VSAAVSVEGEAAEKSGRCTPHCCHTYHNNTYITPSLSTTTLTDSTLSLTDYYYYYYAAFAFSALTLLVGRQEGHPADFTATHCLLLQ